jgi:hypothetical protein
MAASRRFLSSPFLSDVAGRTNACKRMREARSVLRDNRFIGASCLPLAEASEASRVLRVEQQRHRCCCCFFSPGFARSPNFIALSNLWTPPVVLLSLCFAARCTLSPARACAISRSYSPNGRLRPSDKPRVCARIDAHVSDGVGVGEQTCRGI